MVQLQGFASGGSYKVVKCRIPDDCIDSRRYPLFMARAAMRGLVQDLTHATGELP